MSIYLAGWRRGFWDWCRKKGKGASSDSAVPEYQNICCGPHKATWILFFENRHFLDLLPSCLRGESSDMVPLPTFPT